MHKAWGIAIPGLLLVGAAYLRFEDPTPIQYSRNFVFDNFQRISPREYDATLPVRIAEIDEKSLEKFGQWPWSRATMAQVIDRLRELGAAVVALDVIYPEPDRTSPTAIVAAMPKDSTLDGIKAEMMKLPDPDQILAKSLSKMNSVVSFAYLANNPQRAEAPLLKKYDIVAQGAGSEAAVEAASFALGGQYYVATLPMLQEAATGIGAVNAGEPDSDGVIRRVPLVVQINGVLYPTLATEALYRATGGNTPFIKLAGARGEFSFGSSTGAAKMRIGSLIVEPTDNIQLYLYDTGTKAARYVSIADLFEPSFDASRVAGQIILIGATVEGLKDIKATPLSPYMPGVEIHAQMLEQLLSGKYLTRPDWANGLEFVALVGFGALVIGLAYRAGALSGLMLALIVVIAAFAVSWTLFKDKGWEIDPLYPAATTLVLFIATTTINFLRTEQDKARVEREKARIRGTFSMYLSPAMVEQLAGQPEPPKLGGENKEITVMFTDIRGFTKLSEGLDPQALTHVINAFLTPMSKLIKEHQGTIDKYIGDCIMAFWNAPLDVPHHPREAVRTAVEMRRTLKRLNTQFAAEAQAAGREPVKIKAGVGLNTGIGCVGNMGSEERMAYSALGDTVNIAARLESLSPAYFVDLVLGEATAADCADFALLELDQVKVKGKAIPIRIFTCIGTEKLAASNSFQQLKPAHDRMLTAYRGQDWDGAEAARLECLEVGPERLRGFYALYETRIAEFRADPPGAGWDGVYVAKSKTG
jgi:adenylate cyclase